MEFEEGEVDDVSESEADQSPMSRSDEALRRSRSRHRDRHRRDVSERVKPHRSKATKTNGVRPEAVDSHRVPHNSNRNHRKRSSERTKLRDCFSGNEDEVDYRITERERTTKRRTTDNLRKVKKRPRTERAYHDNDQRAVQRTPCRYFMEGRCSKDRPPSPSAGNDHGCDGPMRSRGIGGPPPYAEHGDTDYRFGQRPPQFRGPPGMPNYESRSPPRPMFGAEFNRNQLGPPPPCGNRGPAPPPPPFGFNRHPERMDRPPFGPHLGGPFPNGPNGRPGFFPPRFPMHEPNSFASGPPPPNIYSLSDPMLPGGGDQNNPLLPLPLHPNPVNNLAPPDFMSLPPPFCSLPPPLPITAVRPPSSNNTDALVSSELDKIAAMLASNKPPSMITVPTTPTPTSSAAQILSPPADPRMQSPVGSASRGEETVSQSPVSQSTPDSGGIQQKPLLSTLSSPDSVVAPPTLLNSPSTIPWRLIQLDMSVKIPYPLMQLPAIHDLPHRFEDPRLRGQLTTLRPQPPPPQQPPQPPSETSVSNSFLPGDLGLYNPQPKFEPPPMAVVPMTQAPIVLPPPPPSPPPPPQLAAESPVIVTPRRPVRLQLNEMASTFANTHSASNVSAAPRSGDRSYLDDPRFRRRRVLTSSPGATNAESMDLSSETAVL